MRKTTFQSEIGRIAQRRIGLIEMDGLPFEAMPDALPDSIDMEKFVIGMKEPSREGG